MNDKKIDLSSQRKTLHLIARQCFYHIMYDIDQGLRPARVNEPRSGIMFLMRILETKERIVERAFNPSSDTKFYVNEKSVRTEMLGDVTSQDSEDREKERFRGCISYLLPDGKIIHCSVAGLYGSENVTIAIILLAETLGVSISTVVHQIKDRKGKLPEEICQDGHYLNKILCEHHQH